MREQADWVATASCPVLPGTPLNATVTMPMLLFIVWPRLWTFLILFLMMVALIVLQVKGRDAFWVVRSLKSRLRGRRVSSRPVWYRRRTQRLSLITDMEKS